VGKTSLVEQTVSRLPVACVWRSSTATSLPASTPTGRAAGATAVQINTGARHPTPSCCKGRGATDLSAIDPFIVENA
jgi:hypothetical protein